jgi:long-chain acyl-CoA synthetase
MEKVWLKHYAANVKKEINPDEYSSLVELFEKSCRKYADKSAFSNLGHAITYAELERQSRYFASFLQSRGLKKGDRVAIQMPNLLQYPIVLFGALRAGLVVVNTNPLYTPREMEHQFKDSGVKAIVILANFANHLEQVLPATQIDTVIVTEIGDVLPPVKRFVVNSVVKYVKKMVPPYNLPKAISFRDAMAKGAQLPLNHPNITGQDIAFIQYTGGTTGVSKGAALTHRNMVANMMQSYEMFRSLLTADQEIVITALPLYHIFALTCNCLIMLMVGAHNVLITNPRDMKAFLKDLKKYPFTMITGVNTLYNGLLNQPDFKDISFKHLRLAGAGGMALQRAVAERWHKTTGVPIMEGFGMTETSPVTHFNPPFGENRIGTIGIPVPNTECKLVDDEGNEITAPNERGELCIRGPQVMQGYWQRPDENAKVFLADGFLRTGDIAVMEPDGYFKIVDRKKDMILVSGFNVYPNEVEDVLAHHPGVLEVAAVGVPDEKSGEAVKVFVVRKDPNLQVEALHDFAKEQLTGYKIPKYIEFRNELPKSNVGKILRRPLRDEAVAQMKKQAVGA